MKNKRLYISLFLSIIASALLVFLMFNRTSNYCEFKSSKIYNGTAKIQYFVSKEKNVINFIDDLIAKYASDLAIYKLESIPTNNQYVTISRCNRNDMKTIRILGNIISIVEYQHGLITNELSAVCTEQDLKEIQKLTEVIFAQNSNESSRITKQSRNAASIGFFDPSKDKILKSSMITHDKNNLNLINEIITNIKLSAPYKSIQKFSERNELSFSAPHSSQLHGGLMKSFNNDALAFISYRHNMRLYNIVIYPKFIEIAEDVDSEQVTTYYATNNVENTKIMSMLDKLKQ